MIVSLDDQLEWQESLKSHSPRTPTAPEILQSLRKNSPPPTPSRDSQMLQTPKALGELSSLSGLEALEKLTVSENIKSASIIGDHLCFPDGSSMLLGTTVPLQIRTVSRDENASESSNEEVCQLTVGAAWLSVVAEFTYDSQLASLLRSRKGIPEIGLDDRRIINRYLTGNLSLNGLRASRLWIGESTEDLIASGQVDLDADSNDPITIRTKRRSQLTFLEERKAMLTDQQTRLRRLLARELQRLHSSKSSTGHSQVSAFQNTTSVPVVPQVGQSGNVSSAVANMLKKFKPRSSTVLDGTSAPAQMVSGLFAAGVPETESVHVQELALLRDKLRCLHVEWYRVGARLRGSVETQAVLERKIKRLRYDITC